LVYRRSDDLLSVLEKEAQALYHLDINPEKELVEAPVELVGREI